MNLANKLSLFRIILAPLFFVAYILSTQFIDNAILSVALIWSIFFVSEITDMFDGMAARRLKQTTDFGKLIDPFADTLMQITCFLCFVIDGIIPAVLFLVILYREFGILFIRNLMLKKGIAMGARTSGKVKTVTYIVAASTVLLYIGLYRLGIFVFLQPALKITAIVIFYLSVLFSVISFLDYVFVYRTAGKSETEK
ncbi:MAG: CDP-diacylglycerol--glycerol-3-phosphate 3-phosphatidyltransferase [Treponema sp.]|jgi:CDP-diacylglycerol--glycerol-3-phosphate 3-phosphatidyltransferase|nr:CDP-diacylglycerol--glycerol-3-phosphate 3-phosphatidyltransferase [Treponema sp.]